MTNKKHTDVSGIIKFHGNNASADTKVPKKQVFPRVETAAQTG